MLHVQENLQESSKKQYRFLKKAKNIKLINCIFHSESLKKEK